MTSRGLKLLIWSAASLFACSSDETGASSGAGSSGSSGDGSSGGTSGTSGTSGNTSTGDNPYSQAVLKDAPVAYWRFEEASGTSAKNEVGGAPAGTYFGSFKLAAAGIPGGGKAVELDGKTACIGVGQYFRFPGRVAFSAEGWVKITTYGNEGTRILSTEGFPTGIRSGWNLSASYGNTGYPYFDAWSSEGTNNQYVMGAYSSTSPEQGKLPLGEWNHVVGTFTNEAEEIWVNGVLRNRVKQSSLNRANQGTLSLGCASDGSGKVYLPATGSIDEIAIYDKALTKEQIQNHYKLGSGT